MKRVERQADGSRPATRRRILMELGSTILLYYSGDRVFGFSPRHFVPQESAGLPFLIDHLYNGEARGDESIRGERCGARHWHRRFTK
jgi:hypothetical protein